MAWCFIVELHGLIMAGLYLNTQTGKYGFTIRDVRLAMPNVSVPEHLSQVGVFRRYETIPVPELAVDESVREMPPLNGKQRWSVFKSGVVESVAADVDTKTLRDQKLRVSDWTMMPDNDLTPVIKALWKTYRQQLRDLDCSALASKTIWPSAPPLK